MFIRNYPLSVSIRGVLQTNKNLTKTLDKNVKRKTTKKNVELLTGFYDNFLYLQLNRYFQISLNQIATFS